jgi:hypothetical protein
MKSNSLLLCVLILAVVLQRRLSLACIGSVCQLHQLQVNSTIFLLSGQARYIQPNTAGATGTAPPSIVSFNQTYNLHIHSPEDDGKHHRAFLKIVDKHHYVIKTPTFENGEAAWSNMTVAATGNAKTNTEHSMEQLLIDMMTKIKRVQTNGTKLIFRGNLNYICNLVCNRVPAL